MKKILFIGTLALALAFNICCLSAGESIHKMVKSAGNTTVEQDNNKAITVNKTVNETTVEKISVETLVLIVFSGTEKPSPEFLKALEKGIAIKLCKCDCKCNCKVCKCEDCKCKEKCPCPKCGNTDCKCGPDCKCTPEKKDPNCKCENCKCGEKKSCPKCDAAPTTPPAANVAVAAAVVAPVATVAAHVADAKVKIEEKKKEVKKKGSFKRSKIKGKKCKCKKWHRWHR